MWLLHGKEGWRRGEGRCAEMAADRGHGEVCSGVGVPWLPRAPCQVCGGDASLLHQFQVPSLHEVLKAFFSLLNYG